jgi:hypothetical protein
VLAFPYTSPLNIDAVITLAEKLPAPSRFTTAFGVLLDVAVPPIRPMM